MPKLKLDRRTRLKISRATKRSVFTVLTVIVTFTLSKSAPPSTLEAIKARGVLRIATLEGSTTYFDGARGPNGFEYLLAKAFAESLGVKLEVSVMESIGALLVTLGGPRADMLAAGLTVTPERQLSARFSRPYNHVSQKLIYRLGTKRPRRIEDLPAEGTLVVLADSSHSEQLHTYKQRYPQLQWQERRNTDTLELMEMVHRGGIDFTVADSDAYLVDRSLYPRAKAAFDLTEPQPIAWVFPGYGDTTLIDAANAFLAEYEASGRLERLREQLFGHSDKFSVGGSQLFIHRLTSRLPKFEEQFKMVARRYDMDWHLLAAIAYQESHWNPKARSPTGVRGLMMLTLITAEEMGVKNRLDPMQSLEGGAKYFLKTRQRIPDDITEPDRTWMALAAYNVGTGHLEDARTLAERGKKDSHLWENVKEFLPLLQQKKYYSTVKHGYARGKEPVQYVENIRHFLSILQRNTLEMQRRAEREQLPELPSSSSWGYDNLRPL